MIGFLAVLRAEYGSFTDYAESIDMAGATGHLHAGAAPPQHGDLGASVTARRLMSRTVTGLRLCGLGLLGIPGRASASEPVLVIEGRGSATAWACRRTGPGHGTAGADTATILQTFYPGTSSGHAGGSRCPGARRRQPGDRGRVPRRR